MKEPSSIEFDLRVVGVRQDHNTAVVYHRVDPGDKVRVVEALLQLPDIIYVESTTVTKETWEVGK